MTTRITEEEIKDSMMKKIPQKLETIITERLETKTDLHHSLPPSQKLTSLRKV